MTFRLAVFLLIFKALLSRSVGVMPDLFFLGAQLQWVTSHELQWSWSWRLMAPARLDSSVCVWHAGRRRCSVINVSSGLVHPAYPHIDLCLRVVAPSFPARASSIGFFVSVHGTLYLLSHDKIVNNHVQLLVMNKWTADTYITPDHFVLCICVELHSKHLRRLTCSARSHGR